MEKINSAILIYIDCSGSTGGSRSYWNKVKVIIDQARKDYTEVRYFFWDNNAYKVSRLDVNNRIMKMTGGGGTSPSCFASEKKLPALSDVIIITDGQVSEGEVTKCDKIINGRQFNSMTIYFEQTSSYGGMNLTVSAPFTRNCYKVRIEVGNTTLAEGSTSNIIDLDIYQNNPELFLKESEQILKTIVLQNMGKVNTNLRNSLLELQKNLLRYISTSAGADADSEYDQVREYLESGQKDKALIKLRQIISSADTSMAKRVETIIQELIKQCSGQGGFGFEILEPGRLTRAAAVKPITAEELPQTENVANIFECPISMDNDNPVLLINALAPVLSGLEKGYVEAILTNPFMILNDPKLVEKIKNRIDHIIGFTSTKELFTRGNVVSPFTRNPISCALICEVSSETNKFNKAMNFTLANIFFGSKLVGQSEIWLSVLYLAIRDIPYISENEEFSRTLKAYVIGRLTTGKTNITLSGLPIEPMIKAPIDIALWFCVNSMEVMDLINNPEDDARNRLRSFGESSRHLLELVDIFEYPYDRVWTEKQLKFYKAFAWMMNQEKDHTQFVNGVPNWRNLLRAQYQNSITLDNKVILLDGPAVIRPALPDFGIKLKYWLALAALVDKTKTTNSIMIPTNLQGLPIPEPTVNYGYPEMSEEVIKSPTIICSKTMRPFVIDHKHHKHWKECSEKLYGPIDKQISNFNYFIQYVMEKNSYPTQKEFIFYTAAKQANREVNKMDTLPAVTMIFIPGLFSNYEDVLGKDFKDVPVATFKRLAFQSMREEDRKKLDGSILESMSEK